MILRNLGRNLLGFGPHNQLLTLRNPVSGHQVVEMSITNAQDVRDDLGKTGTLKLGSAITWSQPQPRLYSRCMLINQSEHGPPTFLGGMSILANTV